MTLADLQVSAGDGIVLARIVGEIDMSNSDELRTALAAAMPPDARGMVLDLAGVEYLDSAGIRLLYLFGEDVRARRQKLEVVIPPTSMVGDVLKLAGVTDYVGAVETVDEALDLLRGT
jgi:anti-anti-sigma factor